MIFGLVAILSVLSVKAHGLDTESMLQVSQLPSLPGGSGGGGGAGGFGQGVNSCEDDCTCDHLEYIEGTYTYTDFFPAGNRNEQWCFPNMYTQQTCISVTCTQNATSCTFGNVVMAAVDLVPPSETNLEIKVRLEPDFLNFSVGVVQTGMSFAVDSVASCDLLDGTPAVCSTPTSLEVSSGTVQTIDLAYPRCIEAVPIPVTPASFPPGFPTLAPTPSPALSSPTAAGASGDPHCTNINGENFDVYKRGKINMVTIPQGRDAAEADFSIVVVVTPTWWKACAASFISLAVITRESSCEQITIRPGDGLMPEVEKKSEVERNCNQTSTIDQIGEATVVLKVGERKVKFWQTTKYDKYLNMEIYGLANEQQKVGGILGLDDHEDESEVPEECKRGKRVSSEESDHRVTSISYARII